MHFNYIFGIFTIGLGGGGGDWDTLNLLKENMNYDFDDVRKKEQPSLYIAVFYYIYIQVKLFK